MESTLLVDRNYMAVSVVGWKKALKLLIRGKVESISDKTIKNVLSGNKLFSVPSIVRLKNQIPYNCFSKRIIFSRKNVLLRDAYRCQYCNKLLNKYSGTIDHILPKSRGGKTNYLNCVTCCKDCNRIKRDRTPEEAEMPLIRIPKRPNAISLYSSMENVPKEWNIFVSGV